MNWWLAKPRTLAAWSALCFVLGLMLAPSHSRPCAMVSRELADLMSFHPRALP